MSVLRSSGMTTHVNKVHHVTTINQVAKDLGEDETGCATLSSRWRSRTADLVLWRRGKMVFRRLHRLWHRKPDRARQARQRKPQAAHALATGMIQPACGLRRMRTLHAATNGLNRLARKHGVELRQSYLRIAETTAMMAGSTPTPSNSSGISGTYACCAAGWPGSSANPPQHRRSRRAREAFVFPLGRASQIRSQQQRQRGWKLYSFHAPEAECIGKGKATASCESGAKASSRSSAPSTARVPRSA